ncbi:hypothetical protein BCR34DRAFT_577504 [Clohesyomyces aquaticus]|uniref:Uncharacterized protein n=1 Tax=Clohesyomyces aquaticus TaxID=1231657 RepID=A0A1Y1YJB1_9PLEO|nr:hypothetical protein BCR34DRAFT_577504 [Clohesyomyces aquaticus]
MRHGVLAFLLFALLAAVAAAFPKPNVDEDLDLTAYGLSDKSRPNHDLVAPAMSVSLPNRHALPIDNTPIPAVPSINLVSAGTEYPGVSTISANPEDSPRLLQPRNYSPYHPLISLTIGTNRQHTGTIYGGNLKRKTKELILSCCGVLHFPSPCDRGQTYRIPNIAYNVDDHNDDVGFNAHLSIEVTDNYFSDDKPGKGRQAWWALREVYAETIASTFGIVSSANCYDISFSHTGGTQRW